MMNWDIANPFTVSIDVRPEDIDELGHVNNAVYVTWLEDCAWQHSNLLGLDLSVYQQLDRAMVVIRHEIDYLASAYANDQLQLATWIISTDQKLRITRQFQLIHRHHKITILRAKTTFCCVQLSTGKPKKMPIEFIERYGNVALNVI